MKCTNNRMDPRIRRKASRRRRRRRQRRLAALMITFVILIGVAATGGVIIWGQFRNHTAAYEAENYNKNVYQGTLFSSGLCVTTGEVSLDGFSPDTDLHAAGLFDLEGQNVLCGYKLFDKVYPASTILLCPTCHKLAHSDPKRYSIESVKERIKERTQHV